ncbi:Selenocysteine lyase/Cysteine desulfurase [Bosea sp. CRIB-10]|uniref:aminotransferase class V-fold PLP-dependent enzyme n=1 Tax=Bosea sp. CRIB-10 TaxID=378404 RepID=UPI0008E164FB|nr:aminotransferase class V-fold PLP-dependent enzyme [Bosea sp. CRIB-10]SFC82213.1 Selenocysteine lyase/Cysteine desulfurase [Bosea sp. CRIB-10]
MDQPLDIDALRAETPGAAHRAHFNNAGAALMPLPVIAAMKQHLDREAMLGGYEAAEAEADAISAVYGSVARLINADISEIALTENATVAWQMAFYAQSFRPGDRILTARAEYAANYVAFLQVARRTGATVEVVPDDETGAVNPAALDAMIDERVKLIAITWIPTNGGLINPAAAIGKIARRHGITYLLDACQAVGQISIDVAEIGCDLLTATGRKFLRGPRGTGFLYVRRGLLDQLEPAMIDHFGAPWVEPDRYVLRPDARRFETWEKNYASRLGLGAAIDYALALGLKRIEARCRLLADRIRTELAAIPRLTLHDLGRDRAAIVSFSIEGYAAEAVRAALTAKGISVSVSKPSSTLLDASLRDLPVIVRASPHYYNSDEELERLFEAVQELER